MVSQPQFLLFCDAHASEASATQALLPKSSSSFGRWHFVLDRLDHPEHLEASDSELAIHPDRLALLSVVRGLEALDEPSHVNLVTTSRYVSRGLKYGLTSWRESGYHWERFGIQRPIRNADLWRRVDQALKFHGVTCRLIHPAPQAEASPPIGLTSPQPVSPLVPCGAGATETVGLPAAAQAGTDLAGDVGLGLGGNSRPTHTWRSSGPRPSAHGSAEASEASEASGEAGGWERRLQRSYLNSLARLGWWDLALPWIKWWRGRGQARPALFGA